MMDIGIEMEMIDESSTSAPNQRMFTSFDSFFGGIKDYVKAINKQGIDATIIPADDDANMIMGFGCLETNVVFKIKKRIIHDSLKNNEDTKYFNCDKREELIMKALQTMEGKCALADALSSKVSKIPEDLNQAFLALDRLFPEEEKEFIKKGISDDIMYQYHMSTGRWIRNNWGLWSNEGPLVEYMKNLGLKHPDDMSGVILTSYWRWKHDLPLDVAGQVECYQEYWAKSQN